MMMQDSTEILKTLNSAINTPLSMAINCPELREQISKFKQCSLNTPLFKAINSPELREQISKLAESQLLRPNNPMLIFQQMIKAPNERSVIVNPISKPMLLLEGETPSPKAKAKQTVKIKRPVFAVMLEVAETINKEDEFLPKNFINRTDKLAKYKKAIFGKFSFNYAESTIKNNFDKNLTDSQRLKVVKMLNEYGRMDLAEKYRIQYKSIR